VRRTRSEIAQAQYELKVEQGHQAIAEREWKLLDMQDESSELDRELALRKPHLLMAEASVKAAESALRSAELDLERTTIRAPFNCMVTAENVDLGAQVSPQTQLATLVGTDEYWVQAAVPLDQLQWIEFPDGLGAQGGEAVITQKLGTSVQGRWSGQVVRLLGDLEPRYRMARVLISVPDPLRLAEPGDGLPMLIDAYVDVEIAGKQVEGVFSLPRTALREGQRVWVMNEADQLDIRDVEVVWGNQETCLVRSGLEDGERVVVGDIAAPVAGMALRELDEMTQAETQPADIEPAPGSQPAGES
jgi:RND family efflux transporter MFP subunit